MFHNQAIVISYAEYPAPEAIIAVYKKLSKPVITGNQALVFACLMHRSVTGRAFRLTE